MGGPRVEIGVLGTSTLTVDGVPTPLNARRMRSLLAALVLGPGPTVSSDRLVDALWEHRPSAVASNTLQGYVSRMRRLLEPFPGRAPSTWSIRHAAGAYMLDLGPDGRVDAQRFDAGITAAQAFLRVLPDPSRPEVADRTDQVEVQRERLDRALATWRGEPYADLVDDDVAAAERRRLAERRVDGQTALLVMDLMLGRAAESAAGLEELVEAHPLREQLWRLWAVALVRSDRQAHALEALARLRVLLSSELGIDPSPAVTALQEAILRQDPSVIGAPTSPTSSPSSPAARPSPTGSRTPTYAAPLLGRDRELGLLEAAVLATAAGRGRHAVVVAEPGMGKSRLVAALLDRTRQHQVATVTVRGAGRTDAPPLWSLTRAVADLSARTGVDPPDELRAPPAGPSFEHAVAFADYVRATAALGPVLLVADDLHLLDDATVACLTHLVEDVVDRSVMLLVTRRPGIHESGSEGLAVAIARTGGLWLELPGLDGEDARQLAQALTPDHHTPKDVERLRVRAGGNPRHLATLLEHASPDVPPGLIALVGAELRDLGSDVVGALRVAASAGRRFPAERELEAARRSGLIRPVDDEWEFSSPVVHEAVVALLVRRAPRKGQLALVTQPRRA